MDPKKLQNTKNKPPMIVGSVKEDISLDKRVSITPETAKNFKDLGITVCLEKNYARHIGISDKEYVNVNFFSEISELIKSSNLLAQVNCPSIKIAEKCGKSMTI